MLGYATLSTSHQHFTQALLRSSQHVTLTLLRSSQHVTLTFHHTIATLSGQARPVLYRTQRRTTLLPFRCREIMNCFNPLWPSDAISHYGQHWFRLWLVAWRQQAITWTNVDHVVNYIITNIFQWNTIQNPGLSFSEKKYRCCLQNVTHFVQASMC